MQAPARRSAPTPPCARDRHRHGCGLRGRRRSGITTTADRQPAPCSTGPLRGRAAGGAVPAAAAGRPCRRAWSAAWDFCREMRDDADRRCRPERARRRDRQPAGARDEGLELGRQRASLVAQARAVRRDPFPRRRLYDAGWQADFALDRAGRPAARASMRRMSGAARPRTGPRRTTSRSSSARRAAAGRRAAQGSPSWRRPPPTSPTPTTTTISTASGPRW